MEVKIKYLILILILLPCIAFAAADPVAMFQGAVNPYQTMGQGAVQELTIVTAAATPPIAGPSGAPTQVIINVTQFFCDEVYSWKMIG